MAENVSYLIKINTNLYIQKAQHPPSRINSRAPYRNTSWSSCWKPITNRKSWKQEVRRYPPHAGDPQSKGCVASMQQTTARGKESELASCFCANHPALLRFGNVTRASKTVLVGLWHHTDEESSYAHRNPGVEKVAHCSADAILTCIEGGDLEVRAGRNDELAMKFVFVFVFVLNLRDSQNYFQWLLQGAVGLTLQGKYDQATITTVNGTLFIAMVWKSGKIWLCLYCILNLLLPL